MIPVRCFTCGNVIGDKWEEFSEKCRSLDDAYVKSQSFIKSTKSQIIRIRLSFYLLQTPESNQEIILSRFTELGCPSLEKFAPYSSYVLSVVLFFLLSRKYDLISASPNNITDIAYLFYLPLCMAFVSTDKLHRKIAPFFLRSDQRFIWGPDLKTTLGELNTYYSVFPREEKEKGISHIAPHPPKHLSNLVSELWDQYNQNWRINKGKTISEEKKRRIINNISIIEKAPILDLDNQEINLDDIHKMARKIKVRKKKGDWYQFPKYFNG